jgi:predicted transcriptional regulator
MSKRRSKLEITLDVLKAVRDGVDKPTRIMYVANMSWNPTQELLERLVMEGHLDVTEERTEKRSKKRYVITEKGLNVISYLRGAEALINI